MSAPFTASAWPTLYVYYRVARGHEAQAYEAVRAMQAAVLRRWPDTQVALWRRADEPARTTDEATWMETYALPAGLTDTVLLDALSAHQASWPPNLIGARHVERFCPLNEVPAAPAGGSPCA